MTTGDIKSATGLVAQLLTVANKTLGQGLLSCDDNTDISGDPNPSNIICLEGLGFYRAMSKLVEYISQPAADAVLFEGISLKSLMRTARLIKTLHYLCCVVVSGKNVQLQTNRTIVYPQVAVLERLLKHLTEH